jgi:hypothetical protein
MAFNLFSRDAITTIKGNLIFTTHFNININARGAYTAPIAPICTVCGYEANT